MWRVHLYVSKARLIEHGWITFLLTREGVRKYVNSDPNELLIGKLLRIPDT
jgi:hypothetical protein